MSDILVIFVILLVLLMLISTLGGTLRTETFAASHGGHGASTAHAPTPRLAKPTHTKPTSKPTAPSMYMKEKFTADLPTPVATFAAGTPAEFEPSLSYESVPFSAVATQEEEAAVSRQQQSVAVTEGFATGPIEPFDGSCQYAAVI